jgi:hypothetical protein
MRFTGLKLKRRKMADKMLLINDKPVGHVENEFTINCSSPRQKKDVCVIYESRIQFHCAFVVSIISLIQTTTIQNGALFCK